MKSKLSFWSCGGDPGAVEVILQQWRSSRSHGGLVESWRPSWSHGGHHGVMEVIMEHRRSSWSSIDHPGAEEVILEKGIS